MQQMDGARFYVPLDTKQVISETFFTANVLACYRVSDRDCLVTDCNGMRLHLICWLSDFEYGYH